MILLRTVFVVVFFVFPGALSAQDPDSVIVDAVAIEGNRAISDKDLKLLMFTRANPWYEIFPGVDVRQFNPAVFRSDVERILARYEDQGYFEAVVDTVVDRYRPGFVRIRLRISEGEPVVVSSVRLKVLPGDAWQDSTRLQAALITRTDRPLTRMSRESDLKKIAEILQNDGHPFARAAADVAVLDKRADVTYRVTPGPKCRFGKIEISGNRTVSDDLILRGLTFRTGEAYRRKDLSNSRLQLYRSEAFRSVSLGIPDTVARTSPVDVSVLVRERPARSLKLGAGFDTEEQLRGLLAWRHRSFLGGGARQLTAESSASALEARARIAVRQPYILGSRTWLEMTGFVEQERPEEIRVKRAGASAALERTFRATGRVVFQVRTEVVDFDPDSTRTTFSLEYLEDRRDDYFDPTRGLLAELAVKASGYRDFFKVSGECRWYRKILWKSVLALRVSGGMILSRRHADSIPNFERFFAGGASSVRGWRLNRLGPRGPSDLPVGGLSHLEGSVEVRTRLFSGLGMAVFTDAGNVMSDRLGAFDPGRLRVAVGVGLRYLNPICPARLDVAFRLSDDPSQPDRQIHFSLGQAF
ncbi:MAG: BamA/TamA family outer membrane protein [Gemmatimonadota bacterium]|nr:BamA/TamA family outer membrane protein [Gemmatimonadota bacterium]